MIRLKLFIHPHVVIKYYLLQDIKKIIKKYSFKGNIIDIGCGEKPYEALFTDATEYIGIDFKSYSKNDTFMSNKPDQYFPKNYLSTLNLPFKDISFDHSVAFQVLEHHKSPQKLVNEMIRVTRKNGYILLSLPFIWGIHEEPHDYFRFTEFGLRELFSQRPVRVITILKQGSIASTISLLSMDTLIEFANINMICYVISIILFPLFLIGSYASVVLDKFIRSKKVFLNYLILVQKIS